MRQITFTASRLLCSLGLLIILSASLDYLTISIPPEPNSPQWRLKVFSQLLSRGIVPFTGIALLLAGSWIGELRNSRRITKLPKMRLLSLVCACLLSLIFLLLMPLYVREVRTAQQAAIAKIEHQMNQAEKSPDDASAEQIQQRQQAAVREVESTGRKSIIRARARSLRLVVAYAVLSGFSLVSPNIFRSKSH